MCSERFQSSSKDVAVDLLHLPEDLLERIVLVHCKSTVFTLLQGVSMQLLAVARQMIQRIVQRLLSLEDSYQFLHELYDKWSVPIGIARQLLTAKETKCELTLKFTDVDIAWFVCTPAFFLKVLFRKAVQIELLTDSKEDLHFMAVHEYADNNNATDQSTKFIGKLASTMGQKLRRLLLLKDDVGRGAVSDFLKLLSTEPCALQDVILPKHHREELDCDSAILQRFNVTFYCDLSNITRVPDLGTEPEIFSPPALRRKDPQYNDDALAEHARRQRDGGRRYVLRSQISEAPTAG